MRLQIGWTFHHASFGDMAGKFCIIVQGLRAGGTRRDVVGDGTAFQRRQLAVAEGADQGADFVATHL